MKNWAGIHPNQSLPVGQRNQQEGQQFEQGINTIVHYVQVCMNFRSTYIFVKRPKRFISGIELYFLMIYPFIEIKINRKLKHFPFPFNLIFISIIG